MKRKLNCILLIDDDEDINFLNKIIIEDFVKNIHIESTLSVKDALAFLNSGGNPDIIFLDINMPGSTGWDFMDEFKKIHIDGKEDKKIVMLTSSLDIDDENKARSINEITDYINKPLDAQFLEDFFKMYFEL
jgi:CheY-like chemotaxis protein